MPADERFDVSDLKSELVSVLNLTFELVVTQKEKKKLNIGPYKAEKSTTFNMR